MRISDWSSDVCSSDLATGRARSRQLFGASLASNPITQSRLAEMVAEVDASALLIYRAAWTHDVARRQNSREAAIAKLYATEAAQGIIDNTFLGPLWQKPLTHGADLVFYSLTKYAGGPTAIAAGRVTG